LGTKRKKTPFEKLLIFIFMETKLGDYSAFAPYKEAEGNVISYFTKAMKNIVGGRYTPFAVAHQLVNGMNYAYLTTADAIHPESKPYNVLVIINVAKNTDTEVVSLIEITPIQLTKGCDENLVGGNTAFESIDNRSDLLDVLRKIIGDNYKILAVASQIVDGVKYTFFAEVPDAQDAHLYNVIITLYRGLDGEYNLIYIKRVKIL
jgi:hypothetical protein